jgi:hypothetical protein
MLATVRGRVNRAIKKDLSCSCEGLGPSDTIAAEIEAVEGW